MNYLHSLSVNEFIKETHSPFPNSCHPTFLIPFPLPTSPSPRTLETGTGAHIHDRLLRQRFRPPQLQETLRRRKDTAVLVHFPCGKRCGLATACGHSAVNSETAAQGNLQHPHTTILQKQSNCICMYVKLRGEKNKHGKSIPSKLRPHKFAWKRDLKGMTFHDMKMLA